MPLEESYAEQLKSPIADMKNLGQRFGGAITAALFCKEFVSTDKVRRVIPVFVGVPPCCTGGLGTLGHCADGVVNGKAPRHRVWGDAAGKVGVELRKGITL